MGLLPVDSVLISDLVEEVAVRTTYRPFEFG